MHYIRLDAILTKKMPANHKSVILNWGYVEKIIPNVKVIHNISIST